jgi:hypothetical protein
MRQRMISPATLGTFSVGLVLSLGAHPKFGLRHKGEGVL